MRRPIILTAVTALVAGLAACSASEDETLVIYSGRNENLIGPLLEQLDRKSVV